MIRPATAADAAAVAAVYAPYVEGSAVSFEETAPGPDEVLARMRSGHPWLVAEEADGVVGYAYGSQHRARPAYRWSVEVSVYLAPQAHGRGLGRALYGELLPLLGDLGYVTAYAGIALPNAASTRLHEAMGFDRIGVFPQAGHKLGRWHDTGWYALRLREAPEEPAEPQRWELS